MSEAKSDKIRIDKWLWAARFFKTRALAAAAVAGGKVKTNGERVRAAKAIGPGDELRIHIGPYEYAVRVLGVSARRGPAAQAALLYGESAQSKAAREALATRLSAERGSYTRATGRPSKKERRQIIRLKQGNER